MTLTVRIFRESSKPFIKTGHFRQGDALLCDMLNICWEIIVKRRPSIRNPAKTAHVTVQWHPNWWQRVSSRFQVSWKLHQYQQPNKMTLCNEQSSSIEVRFVEGSVMHMITGCIKTLPSEISSFTSLRKLLTKILSSLVAIGLLPLDFQDTLA